MKYFRKSKKIRNTNPLRLSPNIIVLEVCVLYRADGLTIMIRDVRVVNTIVYQTLLENLCVSIINELGIIYIQLLGNPLMIYYQVATFESTRK